MKQVINKTAGTWHKFARFSFQLLAIAAASLAFVALLYFLRLAVLPAVFGLLLTALVSPLAGSLRRLHIPRALGASLAILTFVAVVVGLGALLGVSLAGELAALKESVLEGYRSLLSWVADIASIPRDELRSWVTDHVDQAKKSLGSMNAKTFTRLVGVVQGLTIATLTLVYAWFFTWDGDKQFKGLVSLFPKPHQGALVTIGDGTWKALSGYIQGIFLVATLDALLLGLGLWAIGLSLVLPLMLLMFIAAFIPFLGPLLTAVLAGLVGLSEGGLATAAMAIGVCFVVQQIEGNLLQPLIMSRTVKLHPVLVLSALTIGGVVGGLTGVFLAVPVAATARTVLLYFQEGETVAT